ncbi:MAG: DUF1887 family CARF protein [Bacillota bacterium]|nr:DUF1887 family CARF protein [Bacillota bacterium]
MEKVHVLFVGGRQAPNVIGTLLLRPDHVKLIISKDEREKKSALIDALPSKELLIITEEEVDATDFGVNLIICERICKQHQDKQIYFNVTCGTKIMGLAAYEIARRFQGTKVFYVDTAKRRIIWLWPLEEKEQAGYEQFKINIEQYLAMYGRKAVRKPVFQNLTFSESQASEAASLLARSIPVSTKILEQIKRTQGSGRRKIQIKNPEEKILVNQLEQKGIIDVEDDAFWIRSNGDWNFLKGDWLEVYVWNEARAQQDHKGQSFFDEVAIGLEIPSGLAQKEIDVACLYQAQLIHCSCKTGSDIFETEYLDELSAVSSLIGGRFCSRIFITNQIFSDPVKEKERRFLEQAKQREVVVVTGDKLVNIAELLKKQAINPDFMRM